MTKSKLWRYFFLPSAGSLYFGTSNLSLSSPSSHDEKLLTNKSNCPKMSSRILFLGSGSSIGNPMAIYLMQKPLDSRYLKNYEISRKAAIGDPRDNRNYRCNPSILIQYNHLTNDETNIIIDTGKTFRESIIRWFPSNNVKSVDAVILTHGHADAIFGLDDIRSVQPLNSTKPMPVYLSKECEIAVRKVFFYLFPSETDSNQVLRFVSNINWINYFHYQSFNISSLTITPFPVMHGEDLESSGFIIGNRSKLCYISDISRMIPSSLDFIKSYDQIELLVVDALSISYEHPTHYSMEQAINLCRQIKPKKCLFVGMGSEIEYHEMNQQLQKYFQDEGLDIQLAHDGLLVDIDL